VLRYARDRHVSVIAAAGDHGADSESDMGGPNSTRGVGLLPASPLVTAVGGTRLTVRNDGAYESESVWNDNLGHGPHASFGDLQATGGGVSAHYARPDYQRGLPVIAEHRGIPDIAAEAPDGHEVTRPGGGTSASVPLWAGIAALADQERSPSAGLSQPSAIPDRP
jgi:kumamolisin